MKEIVRVKGVDLTLLVEEALGESAVVTLRKASCRGWRNWNEGGNVSFCRFSFG